MERKLNIVIKASQDYIRYFGDYSQLNAPVLNSFFESVSDIYIPLLRMVERLSHDGVPCRFSLVIPPLMCSLLADAAVQKLYVEHLEKRIVLGHKELSRVTDEQVLAIVRESISRYEGLKNDFTEKYGCALIPAFTECERNGFVELIGTCGTDLFIPHYADMKEIVSAQIESGLHSFKTFFGTVPDGFWLPALGYMPGVEKLIKAYGYSYTVLDARSVLFSEDCPADGIFYPARTENSLVIFPRDSRTDTELFSEGGISRRKVYRNEKRDIGFDLEPAALEPVIEIGSPRYTTGYKYWNRCFENGEGSVYRQEEAFAQARADAVSFVEQKSVLTSQAAALLGEKDFVAYTCTFDTDDVRDWSEFPVWLEQLFRAAAEKGLSVVSGNQMLGNQYSLAKFAPYYSAGLGDGYGENLLSNKNCWMIRHVRKACERMIDLAERFPNDSGLKTRLLNLGAKELMLSQSLRLARAVDGSSYPEFAERRFCDSIRAFTAVFDSLGSNTVSTEWLTTMEMQDSFFPWMNYRIFSKKR